MSSSTKTNVLAALDFTTSTTILGLVSYNFRINILSFLIDYTNILIIHFFNDFCLGKPADWQYIPGIDDAAYSSSNL